MRTSVLPLSIGVLAVNEVWSQRSATRDAAVRYATEQGLASGLGAPA